jgi:hypothetical protein
MDVYKPAYGVARVVYRRLKMWARRSENVSQVDERDELDNPALDLPMVVGSLGFPMVPRHKYGPFVVGILGGATIG